MHIVALQQERIENVYCEKKKSFILKWTTRFFYCFIKAILKLNQLWLIGLQLFIHKRHHQQAIIFDDLDDKESWKKSEFYGSISSSQGCYKTNNTKPVVGFTIRSKLKITKQFYYNWNFFVSAVCFVRNFGRKRS